LNLPADDYAAIQQLYARYAFAIDLRDFDGWLTTWTEDAVFVSFASGAMEGHAAIRAFAEAAMASPDMKGYHWNSNVVIEPTDYGAAGKCYIMHVLAPDGWGEVGRALYYEDELVKQDGGWRFRRRTVRKLPDA
jgi:uncharacterized protein (TIGR02246 family)